MALIKQDAFSHKENIVKEILKNEFKVVTCKEVRMTRESAEKFYGEHRGKFFFPRLVSFMSRGPTLALILEKEDAISNWRKLMGPTHLQT